MRHLSPVICRRKYNALVGMKQATVLIVLALARGALARSVLQQEQIPGSLGAVSSTQAAVQAATVTAAPVPKPPAKPVAKPAAKAGAGAAATKAAGGAAPKPAAGGRGLMCYDVAWVTLARSNQTIGNGTIGALKSAK